MISSAKNYWNNFEYRVVAKTVVGIAVAVGLSFTGIGTILAVIALALTLFEIIRDGHKSKKLFLPKDAQPTRKKKIHDSLEMHIKPGNPNTLEKIKAYNDAYMRNLSLLQRKEISPEDALRLSQENWKVFGSVSPNHPRHSLTF